MRLVNPTGDEIAVAAREWAQSGTALPFVIAMRREGLVCEVKEPCTRFNKSAFAQALQMSRNTFRQLEQRLGLTPASDGRYDAETVSWAKSQLAQEESRKSPHVLRLDRRCLMS